MVKRAARQLVERHYHKMTMDFDVNKRVLDEVSEVPSKRVRNKIAGYSARLMRRIQRGPVRGISLKLQEEERERRLDFLPEVSFADKTSIEIDAPTRSMLKHYKIQVDGVVVPQQGRGKKFNKKAPRKVKA
jgi:small subunit ribosomal protein S17e